MGMKVERCKNNLIYSGLIKKSRKNEKYSAKQKNDRATISYKVVGGKALFVLSENHRVPAVHPGEYLYMAVDYQNN